MIYLYWYLFFSLCCFVAAFYHDWITQDVYLTDLVMMGILSIVPVTNVSLLYISLWYIFGLDKLQNSVVCRKKLKKN